MSKPPSREPPAGNKLRTQDPGADVQAFLQRARNVRRFSEGQSRLVFAIDATASRQPTWDLACSLQADMFNACSDIGSLRVQLAYYRGLGEVHLSDWHRDARELAGIMSRVDCRAGRTQIARTLRRVLEQQGRMQARALVFIGDAMEESAGQLEELAGQCRLHSLPLFMFQEGQDQQVRSIFLAMASISGGAYDQFNSQSASRLRELLGAVARYAAGGRKALEATGSAGARHLLKQLGP